MKLRNKQRTGERVFGHHTADEAPTSPEEAYGGVSRGAEADPRSTAILERLEALPDWPAAKDYLGPYRFMVGHELSGRNIAMVACKDGRTYETRLLDDATIGYTESHESVASRLYAEIKVAIELPKVSRLERFLRYGRKGIE